MGAKFETRKDEIKLVWKGIWSHANGLLQLGNLMLALHDGLLHEGLVALELNDLFGHVIILFLLLNYARLQLLEVGHYVRVNDFDIFIVLGR